MAKQLFDGSDFNEIVSNFIEFLKSQSQFNDYNFDGSSIRTLIDTLAFNTQYLNFYLNQVASEMFLDSAILRSSVVSRAKHLNYTPRSIRTSRAIVNLTIDTTKGPGPSNPPFIKLDQNTKFKTSIDNKIFTFTPIKTILIKPVGNVYSAENVELVEGERLQQKIIVDKSLQQKQRFIILNDNVDETTLTVKVQKSINNPSIKIFKRHEDINEVTNTSLIYFLQENVDGKLELIFGDGVVGQALEDGNIVILDYVVSSGNEVNGADKFVVANGIDNYTSVSVTTVLPASLSIPKEDIESIRKLAPLNFESQNRAVTKLDFESLLKSDIPDLEFIRVWGGEEEVPSQPGRIFISMKPKNRLLYSTEEKESIKKTHIQPRSIISLETIFVDPKFIRLNILTTVRFDPRKTSLSSDDIKEKVFESIQNFKNIELNGFNSDFRHSKLVEAINSSDSSIESNLTNIILKYRLTPPFNVPTDFDIDFQNKLDRGDIAHKITSINSSGFFLGNIETFIQDNGDGSLEYYRIVNDQRVVIQQNIGEVDYELGKICLRNLNVSSLPNNVTFLDITAIPEKQDILASKEQIIIIEDEDINIIVEEV